MAPSRVTESSYGTIPDYEARRDLNWNANGHAGHAYGIKTRNYQLYTLTSCMSDIITASTEEDQIRFPRISETESELSQDRAIVPVPKHTKAEVLQTSGNNSDFRLRWLKLPF